MTSSLPQTRTPNNPYASTSPKNRRPEGRLTARVANTAVNLHTALSSQRRVARRPRAGLRRAPSAAGFATQAQIDRNAIPDQVKAERRHRPAGNVDLYTRTDDVWINNAGIDLGAR